jgi:hypothetical protein
MACRNMCDEQRQQSASVRGHPPLFVSVVTQFVTRVVPATSCMVIRTYAVAVATESDQWAAYRDRVEATEEEWDEFVRQTPVGRIVKGVVVSHHPFGFFLDIGWGTRCLGLVEVVRIRDADEPIDIADYPPVGSLVQRARVLGHTPHNRQARLTIRPSDLAEPAG